MRRSVTEPPNPPEIKKRLFITHVGDVSVNNYGTVEFELAGSLYAEPRKVIWSVDTLRELQREVREAVTEMRKEGTYAR